MIEVSGLSKTFSGRAAVRGLSFTAADGAITGLLGANGAGKTTTVRMICGVLRPDSGVVRVDGHAAGDAAARQGCLGALLDHAGIYSRLTARENLTYFGRLRGMPEAILARRVDEVLGLLGLGALADRRTAGFSQGERMKTALGRAILHSAPNLVLDEPTNGLDILSVRSLREILRRMRDAGTCILLSSHVLEEARALCDRVVIISGGRLAGEGSPGGLCERTGTPSLEEAFVQLTCEAREAAC
jgi:sodium transport system ATP-binding protein